MGSSRQHPIGQLADPDVFGRLHGQAEVEPATGWVHAQREPEPSGEDVADAGNERPQLTEEVCEMGGDGPCLVGDGIGGGMREYAAKKWWSTEPGLGGMADELARGLDLHGTPESGSVPRVATGIAKRADRLKCIGNGQVPAAAVLAWTTLYKRIAQ
jgi:hypothetical protein